MLMAPNVCLFDPQSRIELSTHADVISVFHDTIVKSTII